MPLVVDRDVFPVDVGDLEPELADDLTIPSDREEQGGVPRVVMNPIDARITAALDDARRLRNSMEIESTHLLEAEASTPSRPRNHQARERIRHRRETPCEFLDPAVIVTNRGGD